MQLVFPDGFSFRQLHLATLCSYCGIQAANLLYVESTANLLYVEFDDELSVLYSWKSSAVRIVLYRCYSWKDYCDEKEKIKEEMLTHILGSQRKTPKTKDLQKETLPQW